MTRSFFATTAPGLEEFTAQELRSLGISRTVAENTVMTQPEAEKGGIAFDGSLAELYRANLHLRTASRILLRVADFRAIGFTELRKKAGRVAWEQYLSPGQSINLRVSCHKSRLYHSSAVAERIAGAIGDRLGLVPPVISAKDEDETQGQAQVILVRLLHDQCTISMDSSGELLHRRGYRQAVAKAPLRETLAAGLLLASGWNQQAPLLDPFCGSGSIPIEAALQARNIPPGLKRSFAFMNWQDFDQKLWQSILEESRQQIRTECPPVLASDRDAGAIELAKSNAERASVLENIEFSCRAVSAIEPKGKGWVVTNPPYGLRVSSSKDLRNLYAQLGNVLRSQCPGWRVAILCSESALLHQTRLKLDLNTSLVNGGVPVRLGIGEVPE